MDNGATFLIYQSSWLIPAFLLRILEEKNVFGFLEDQMYLKGALPIYFIHIGQIKVVAVSVRYRTEVYTKDLDSPNSDWVPMPELPDSRMWHGCVVAEVDGVRGEPSQ